MNSIKSFNKYYKRDPQTAYEVISHVQAMFCQVNKHKASCNPAEKENIIKNHNLERVDALTRLYDHNMSGMRVILLAKSVLKNKHIFYDFLKKSAINVN